MDLQFVEDSVYLNFIKSLGLSAEEYTGQNAGMIGVAKGRREDKEKGGSSELTDIFKERSQNLTITPVTDKARQTEQGKNITVMLADTIPTDTLPKAPSEVKPYVFVIVLPYERLESLITPDAPVERGLTFLSENPSRSVDEMKAIMDGAGVTAEYTLSNVYEMLEENRNILFIVNLFATVFVIMISLIATANVFNTISTNIRLRRRELAMLRSVGMSDRDFNRMMLFECALYGLRTLLFGLPAAGLLSWLIYRGMISGGAVVTFAFPWGSMAVSILGVFFVIFITMLYAAGQIQRENIIDALRDDMT